MQVISIQKIKKNYLINFSDELELLVFEEVVLAFQLFLNKKITKEELKEINNLNSFYEGYYKAMYYLKKSRFTQEIYLYLLKIYKEEMVLQIIEKLKSLKLLDDKIQAENFLEYKKRKGFGINYILQELRPMELDEEIILHIKELYSLDEEIKIGLAVAKKYMAMQKGSKKAIINKTFEYCLAKGFTKKAAEIILTDIKNDLENKDDTVHLEKEMSKVLPNYLKKYTKETAYAQTIRNLSQKGYEIKLIIEMLNKKR